MKQKMKQSTTKRRRPLPGRHPYNGRPWKVKVLGRLSTSPDPNQRPGDTRSMVTNRCTGNSGLACVASVPTVLFLALVPFSAQAKYRKPRSSVFLCSQTLRKRLLRRLFLIYLGSISDALSCLVYPRGGARAPFPNSGWQSRAGRYVMYGDIYCTEIYISYIYTLLS